MMKKNAISRGLQSNKYGMQIYSRSLSESPERSLGKSVHLNRSGKKQVQA